MPTASPTVLTLTVADPAPVPDAGLTVSHVALSLRFQLSAPPPVLVMASAWLAGFAPPCVAVNPMLAGLNPMAADVVTVSDMVMIWGVLVAPVAVIVTGAL